MKQTAVEWLVEQYKKVGLISISMAEQAKEMEKEQIKDAFVECWKANMPDGYECKLSAEEYYNDESKCVFEARTDTTSATICKWCGQEKFLHKY
jgi:hypothetical protein